MKKIIIVSFTILFLLGNLSCSKDCGNALADLITDIAIQGTVSILAGTPFSVPNVITNVVNTIESCKDDIKGTVSAGSSQSRISLDYDLSGDGSFSQNEVDINFDVPSIPAGMVAEETYTVDFNDPGNYRLITFADDKNDVEERDENNNKSADLNITAGRGNAVSRRMPLIIKVLPNTAYHKPANAPNVEITSRTVELKFK